MLKKLLVCLIGLMFLTMAVVPVLAQNHDWVEFFWAEGCPHCAKEKVFLTELKTKYPDLVIKSYEISQNLVNALLLQQRGRDLNADVSGVPFTIIGDEYVSGFRDNETTGKEIETR